jgi:3-deoxy-D-manno-octulosonic acid kinase
LIFTKKGALRVAFSENYPVAVKDALFTLLSTDPEKHKSSFGVVHLIRREQVAGIGPVIVKYYTRRGLLKFFIRRTYLGRSRAEQEMKALLKVRRLGVNAPLPLAAATLGRLFRRAQLVSSEIVGKRSLPELKNCGHLEIREALEKLVEQIELLVKAKILHIDLHPENVLIDPEGKVYLIDFDKAREFKGSRRQLRMKYLNRWRRAVIKHGLPDIFSEIVALGMRRIDQDGE